MVGMKSGYYGGVPYHDCSYKVRGGSHWQVRIVELDFVRVRTSLSLRYGCSDNCNMPNTTKGGENGHRY